MMRMAEPPFENVFGADRAQITKADLEREDWSRLLIPAGEAGAICAGTTFWHLFEKGPVVAVFEDRLEGHAILEACAEARRRLH
jgi:hypothetical protein